MAATAAPSSCAAAVLSSEDGISTASGSATADASSPGTPVAAPNAGAACGRTRGGKKPQIDIDGEIQEANKLAELFKKMQKASKVAARNAGRQRQRLVRKAQKLSEQDLMRLAVLKRGGMFVPDESVLPASASGADAGPAPAKKSKAQETISNRFKTLVTGVAGANELVEAMNMRTDNNSTQSTLSAASCVRVPAVAPLSVSCAPVLQRLPSRRTKLPAVVAAAAAHDEVDGNHDDNEHETGEHEADEGDEE